MLTPVNPTVCAAPGAGLTVIVAVFVPAEVGWKVTVMVQLPLAGTLAPQVFVCE